MPYSLGAMDAPTNPNQLPNSYPFKLVINSELARLEQSLDKNLDDILEKTYLIGNEMGTPSDNTELGIPYVDDFLSFVGKPSSRKKKLLEIGAGTGYLSKCFLNQGWDVKSIEPGKGYEKYWDQHNIEIINEFFPSKKIKDEFDVIVFYTVLEHIKDTRSFLKDVLSHLKPNGEVYVAVPDCTFEILEIDPSILIHEHFHYFTKQSIKNTFAESGFECSVLSSTYGRTLFAKAKPSLEPEKLKINKLEIIKLKQFIQNLPIEIERMRNALKSFKLIGDVGIFCPGRALNYLPHDEEFLFYDDSEILNKKYLPPFDFPILSRKDLLKKNPKTLFIASRTFGNKIKKELIHEGLSSNIILIEEITK